MYRWKSHNYFAGRFRKIYSAFVAVLLLSASPVLADEFDKFALEIIEGIPNNLSIAVQPIDPRKAKISVRTAEDIIGKLTNALAKQSKKKKIKIIDRANFKTIMREREEFLGEDDFTKLIKKAGADVLVTPMFFRESGRVSGSVRATAITGSDTGSILSATKTYKLDIPIRYAVSVDAVYSNGDEKDRYRSALETGASALNEIKISSSKNKIENDFEIKVEYEYSVSKEKTKESREAEQGKKAMAGMSNLMSGMLGKNNPMASMTASIGGSVDSEAAKKIVIIADVTSIVTDHINDRLVKFSIDDRVVLPGDASKDSQRNELRSKLRSLVAIAAENALRKAIGKPVKKSKKKTDALD